MDEIEFVQWRWLLMFLSYSSKQRMKLSGNATVTFVQKGIHQSKWMKLSGQLKCRQTMKCIHFFDGQFPWTSQIPI